VAFNKFCYFSELNKETSIISNEARKEESILAFGMQVVPFGLACLNAMQCRKCLAATKPFLYGHSVGIKKNIL
jgi:hypothetical protein